MFGWLKHGWAGTGARDIYRAEKFLQLRARYEMIVELQNVVPLPSIATLLARVPIMATNFDANVYLRQVRHAITWADVDALEEAVIGVLPDSDLIEQLAMARLAYSQTVTQNEYANYQRTMIGTATAEFPLGPPLSARVRSELLAVTQRTKYTFLRSLRRKNVPVAIY